MEQKRLELTGRCTSCFAPNGVLVEYGAHYDYLCPKCAAAQDRRDQADRHLVSYLTVVLGPYKEHWAARGLTPLELADLLEGAANEVSEVMRDEGIKARDAAESE